MIPIWMYWWAAACGVVAGWCACTLWMKHRRPQKTADDQNVAR